MVAMEIREKVELKFKDGPRVIMPDDMIVREDEGTWVRMRPSHYCVAKLILGHMEDYKSKHQPSLSGCKKFAELNKKIHEKAMEHMVDDGKAADDVFAQGDEGEQPKKKQKKIEFRKAPSTLIIDVGGKEIEVKTPSSLKESDIVVKLDADMLSAFCEFVAEDENIQTCMGKEKRAYVKSGSFKKT